MKAAVLTFPGSNCDQDLLDSLRGVFNIHTELLWHTEPFTPTHDIYFIPGGFAYGDYIRTGALAAQSKSLDSLREAYQQKRPIIGICNGFQILCEAKMLPGALIKNTNLQHICEWTPLQGSGDWQGAFPDGFALPISHGEGNFICSEGELKSIQDNGQALLRYTKNPNGATYDIAALASKDKRVIGLMPHPERALEPTRDSAKAQKRYGRLFFEKIFSMVS